MTTKIGAYSVAESNAMMGLDILNTASENLSLVTSHLSRIRDLAEQAANGTYGLSSLDIIQKEIDQRTAEISRVMKTTEYNGIQLYGDGSPISTGDFVDVVKPLTEEEAVAQGYQVIKTVDDLNNIRNNPKGKYILMNDIDLSGYNWEPMDFNGTLDGNGYVIKNLTINKSTEDNVGFIRNGGANSNVCNLGLENINITGHNNVGGFAGGLAYITNCYVTGKVNGNQYVGGLIGATGVSTYINNCYSAADVYGNSSVGGLLGNGSSSIKNSFTLGNVSGNRTVGGIAGYNAGGGHISYCYVVGRVTGTTNVGGIMGGTGNTFSNVYWNPETTGQSLAIGTGTTTVATAVTTSELNKLISDGTLLSIAPETLKGGSIFNLQVGIDSSQNSVISFDTTFSFELNLNVLTNASARNSITVIDNIISHVSSRSTLRDADIAEESSQYIKMQILQQASATLLATANQSPSIALQLL